MRLVVDNEAHVISAVNDGRVGAFPDCRNRYAPARIWGRYADFMKRGRRQSRSKREPVDALIDVWCWIRDGRLTWNRKCRHPREKLTESMTGFP
jgi:hypothetical protein